MPLNPDDRRYVVDTAVQILRHQRRGRLIDLLDARLDRGDYADEQEQERDRVVHAVVHAVDEELAERR